MRHLARLGGLRPRTVALLLATLLAFGLTTPQLVMGSAPDRPGATVAELRRDVEAYLTFSRDGREFSPTPVVRAFDPEVRWVPGDKRRAGFWIRNEGPDPGNVTLEITRGPTDRLADVRAFKLKVQGRAFKRAWSRNVMADLRRDGVATLVLVNHLRPGRRARIALKARLAPSSGNRSQGRPSDLGVLIRMEQDPDSRSVRAPKGGRRG